MTSSSIPAELLQVRKEIDAIDRELVALLAARFSLTHKVGVLKASNALQAVDAERESQKIAELRTLCQSSGLNPDLVTELFTRIMQEVVKNHRELASQRQ